MSPIRNTIGLLTVLVVGSATILPAQRYGMGAHIGYYTLSGDDFEGIDAGLGFQGDIWYSLNPKFRLGAGVLRSSHDIDIDVPGVDIGNVVNLYFYLEPRLAFVTPGTRFTPFLGARVGILRQGFAVQGFNFRASGFAVGATGGLALAVGPSTALEFTVSFTRVNLGDFEVDGDEIPDSESSGNALGIQLGVTYAFGRP